MSKKKKKREKHGWSSPFNFYLLFSRFFTETAMFPEICENDRSIGGSLSTEKESFRNSVNSFQMTDITCCRPGNCWCSRWHRPTPSRAIVAGPCTVSPATPWKVPRTRGSWSPVSFQRGPRIVQPQTVELSPRWIFNLTASARLKFRCKPCKPSLCVAYLPLGWKRVNNCALSLFLSLVVYFLRNLFPGQ